MPPSNACLVCGSREREPVLDLGETPLANRFLKEEDLAAPEPRFPLAVVFCARCGLVQLSEVVPPALLFAHYVYMTGASTTMVRHFEALARSHAARLGLGRRDLVVEVASNDGTLLQAFAQLGVRTLGIEPASNLARRAEEAGIRTVNRFFDAACAAEVRAAHGPAALACANNVLAHVADLPGVLEGLRVLVEPEGLVSVEVPYLLPMLERLEYDTIYHEHLCYFSVRALAEAFGRHGLGIAAIQDLGTHGGSLRVLARPGERHAPEVEERIAAERARGLEDLGTFRAFAARVAENRTAVRGTLEGFRRRGLRVAAYGAAAKGNTLLNVCGIGPDLVDYVVDKNPLKVGTWTPGMRIPVRDVALLAEDRPDVTLILPWNLAAEIVAQERRYRERGGRFLVPVPEPSFV